jgi:hypothetical protein
VKGKNKEGRAASFFHPTKNPWAKKIGSGCLQEEKRVKITEESNQFIFH